MNKPSSSFGSTCFFQPEPQKTSSRTAARQAGHDVPKGGHGSGHRSLQGAVWAVAEPFVNLRLIIWNSYLSWLILKLNMLWVEDKIWFELETQYLSEDMIWFEVRNIEDENWFNLREKFIMLIGLLPEAWDLGRGEWPQKTLQQRIDAATRAQRLCFCFFFRLVKNGF